MKKKIINRNREAKKTGIISFFLNLLLTFIKIFIGLIGKSSALIADGLHSFSDLITDFIVIAALKFSAKPHDANHNYGHGKIENMAALLIGFILIAIGLIIGVNSTKSIITIIKTGITPAIPGIITIIAAAISIISKELLYRYTMRKGKELNSPSLIANAKHHRSDSLSSIAVFFGIGASILLGAKFSFLDPVAALFVSLLIIKFSFVIIKENMNILIDASLPEETEAEINKLVNSFKSVKMIKMVKTRSLGFNISVDISIGVATDLNIVDAHYIATTIEKKFNNKYGKDSVINVHVEPEAIKKCKPLKI